MSFRRRSALRSSGAALRYGGRAGIVIVLVACFIAVCYLVLLPRTGAKAKLSSNVSEAPSPGEQEVPMPAALPKTEGPSEGSIETAGVTGEDDTLVSLLTSNLADDPMAKKAAVSLARAIAKSRKGPFGPNSPLGPERSYRIITDIRGRFLKATLELAPDKVFHAVRKGDEINCWKEDVVLDFKLETLRFVVRSSVYESILRAGEGSMLASKLKRVFQWDIDFNTESQQGDVCKILFKRRYADDRPSGYGEILCAVYQGKKTGRKVAVLFNGKYYDASGVELKKDFLRSPLEVLRVTSRFGRRFHPILKVWRRHNGVDYGAPKGTPVRSIAHGTVIFAGWARGYGKYVRIKHDNGIESRYGHLSRIYVKKGQRVKQGYKIGLVGMTGMATGPHLDFQLLVGGKHKDPTKFKMVRVVHKIDKPLRPRFERVVRQRLLSLTNLLLSERRVPAGAFAFR